ncbi:MAG: sporulation initiation inhibitor Soj [Latescibacteria bacterium DG_63]|nr:MAG: sporulation initiation inhibitor Soj [Latescibacteria bacterium DG_63]
MGRVIAVANQKGGVGKTTTAVNLSACLAQLGKKVLLLDVDPQGNASSGVGVNGDDAETSIYEVLVQGADITKAIAPGPLPLLDVVPSGQRLIGAEIELVGMLARESRLRGSIMGVKDKYDFCFLDCPPSLGLITINTLTAADSVLIPVQCEYYALEGIGQLLGAIRLVQENLNPALRIEGVLLTMYDSRLNLSQQVMEETRNFFADRVYRTVIPRNVKLSEAPGFGKPVILYDARCPGAQGYTELAKEVMRNG